MKWHRAMTEIAGTEIKAKMIIMKKVGEKENYNPLRVLREMGVTLGFFFFYTTWDGNTSLAILRVKSAP